jgi:hypothetical protein
MLIEKLQRYGHGEDHPFLPVAGPLQESHRTFLRTAGYLPQHLPKSYGPNLWAEVVAPI